MNKFTKLGIILAVIIVIAFGVAAIYKKPKQAQTNLITYKDNHLTDANKEIYNKKLQEISVQLNNSTSPDEKFNLYMQQGYNYYGLGQLVDAKNSFELAIQTKPSEYVGYTALFQDQVDMGDNDGALRSIQKAIELKSSSADVWRKYILFETDILHADNGKLNDLYVQALDKTGGHVDILTVYAQFLEKSGNLQAAKEYWQKAITAYPKNKAIFQAEIDRLNKLLQQK